MTETVKNINIDVQKKRAGEAVVAKQGDAKSRFLRVTVCSGGTKITVAQDAEAVINASRPDGASKSFFCTVNSDGTVTAPLTGWMLECAGVLRCSVSVLGSDGERLTSTTFFVDVEPAEVTDGDIENDESVDVLAELVVECREAAGAAGAAASVANGAASTANEAASSALSAAGAANRAASSANSAAEAARAVADSKLDKSAVVQETGEGVDVVMSQGAVTEQLDGKAVDAWTSEKPLQLQKAGIYNYRNIGTPYIDGIQDSEVATVIHGYDGLMQGQNLIFPYGNGNFNGVFAEICQGGAEQSLTKLLSETDIVQGSGTSADKVMSQKAVTEAIAAGGTQGVNLFGFNKGIYLDPYMSSTCTLDEDIYGLSDIQIDNVHKDCRIRNLGFNDIGGWYTVSGEFYATTSVDIALSICNANRDNYSLNTTPKTIVSQGYVTQYYDSNGFNGFVDIAAQSPQQNEARVYVKNLKIERGKVDNPVWTPAPEDVVTSWSGAGFHNSLYRGKMLGTSVTEAQYAAISSGTFDDLYVGDYWTINGVNWLIAGFDYLYQTGDTALTKHHAVIIPEKCLYNAQMNDTGTTEGGYASSQMRTQNLESAKETINAAFPGHVLTYRGLLTNAVTDGHPSGYIWEDCSVELMTEVMCCGTHFCAAVANNGVTVPTVNTTFKTQLPIFRMAPGMITMREANVWLQDVCSSAGFCFADYYGGASLGDASYSCGVRPFFLIGG